MNSSRQTEHRSHVESGDKTIEPILLIMRLLKLTEAHPLLDDETFPQRSQVQVSCRVTLIHQHTNQLTCVPNWFGDPTVTEGFC